MLRTFCLLLTLATPSLGSTQTTSGSEASSTADNCNDNSSIAKQVMDQTALAKWAVLRCDDDGSAVVPVDGMEWVETNGTPHVFQASSQTNGKGIAHFEVPRFFKIPDGKLGPANTMLILQGGSKSEFKDVYKIDLPTTQGELVMLMFYANKDALGYVLGCRGSWQQCILLHPRPKNAKNATNNTPAQTPFAQTSKDWGSVSGGWHLNNRCRLLSAGDASEYNANVEAIRQELGKDQQTQPLIALVERAGQEEAGSARYADCGRAKQIVQEASKLADQWQQRFVSLPNNCSRIKARGERKAQVRRA